MKLNANLVSTTLMAIAAITLIIVGISEGSVLFLIAGGLFFLAILIMRARQTRKLNQDIENIEKEIKNEISDHDDQ
jgi:uncharacterized protein (DUF58 family)